MKVAGNAAFCTLVLDSKQYPRISYADFGTGLGANLRYATWDGSAWKTVPITIQVGAVVAYYTSIALDANDKPFFSFYDYADPSNTFRLRMRSVFSMGNYWEANTVDPQGGSGKFNSIAVDSKGNPHIAYANVRYESSSLRYASWDGKAWKTEILDGADASRLLSIPLLWSWTKTTIRTSLIPMSKRVFSSMPHEAGGRGKSKPWIRRVHGTRTGTESRSTAKAIPISVTMTRSREL